MFLFSMRSVIVSVFISLARSVNVDERYNDPGLATYITVCIHLLLVYNPACCRDFAY